MLDAAEVEIEKLGICNVSAELGAVVVTGVVAAEAAGDSALVEAVLPNPYKKNLHCDVIVTSYLKSTEDGKTTYPLLFSFNRWKC